MTQRPAASLPDVFAKPGQAPARGTPIEDLPRSGADDPPAAGANANGAAANGANAIAAAANAAAATPIDPPRPVDPPPVARPASPPEPTAAPTVSAPPPREAPPPARDHSDRYDANPVDPPASSTALYWAIAAGVIGITGPLWQDSLFRTVGITTSVSRSQQEDAIAIGRLDRKSRDVEQRLATAGADLAKVQGELVQSVRRQEEIATAMRAMALAQLASSLRRSVPFASDLILLNGSGRLPNDLSVLVDQIADYGPIGVPSSAEVEQDFRRIADQIERTSRGYNPVAWIASAAPWIPLGRLQPATDPAVATIRQASVAVSEGNTMTAIEIIRQLDGPQRDMFVGWTADARARIAADAIIRRANDGQRSAQR